MHLAVRDRPPGVQHSRAWWWEAAHFSPWSSGGSCFWRSRQWRRRPTWWARGSSRDRSRGSCARSTRRESGTEPDPCASPHRCSGQPVRTRARCSEPETSPTETGIEGFAATACAAGQWARRSPGASGPTARAMRSSGCGSRARRTRRHCSAAASATSASELRQAPSPDSPAPASRPQTSPAVKGRLSRPGASAARRSSPAGAGRARRAEPARAAARRPMRARPG